MITLYNIISADGYIARGDGSEDFIPDDLWPETLKFLSKYDTLVMGKNTYSAMQKYSPELLEPFEELDIKKVVVTHDDAFLPNAGYAVAHSVEEALNLGDNVLVCSGPGLNDYILQNKLADKIVLWQLPVEIGSGIKPFNIETDIKAEITPI